MNNDTIRKFATIGASHRLREITDEARTILADFPEIVAGFPLADAPQDVTPAPAPAAMLTDATPKRRKRTAAQRATMSAAAKLYWNSPAGVRARKKAAARQKGKARS